MLKHQLITEIWKISKKSMPIKLLLEPELHIIPFMIRGYYITRLVKTDSMEELYKSQEQFIKALQIVFENGIREVWISENLELVNNIRISSD